MTSLVQELAEAAAETAPTAGKRGLDMEKEKKKEKVVPYKNKKTLTVYLVLRALVIFVMVRAFFRGAIELHII